MPHSLQECLSLACLLEATAPKVGNVHRGADFEDLAFTDFAVSAVLAAPHLADAAHRGVGRAVYDAVSATRAAVGTNTNLGMALLLAPLAAAGRPAALGIQSVLESLDAADAENIYAAIRLAEPGGLGRSEEHDIQGSPPKDLLAAMRHAAERDLIAAEYASGFSRTLEIVAPELASHRAQGWSLTEAIIRTHVLLISRFGDSLIARKCGEAVSREAADRATHVLNCGGPGDSDYEQELAEFDFWLRINGHRRNPGATADLVAAGLFVAMREEMIEPPYR